LIYFVVFFGRFRGVLNFDCILRLYTRVFQFFIKTLFTIFPLLLILLCITYEHKNLSTLNTISLWGVYFRHYMFLVLNDNTHLYYTETIVKDGISSLTTFNIYTPPDNRPFEYHTHFKPITRPLKRGIIEFNIKPHTKVVAFDVYYDAYYYYIHCFEII